MEHSNRIGVSGDNGAGLLTVREVAERLKVSVAGAYAIIAEGKLACYRVGRGRGTIRVRPEDLDVYLARCRFERVEQAGKPARPRLKHLKL